MTTNPDSGKRTRFRLRLVHLLKLVGLACILWLIFTFDFSAVIKLWLELDLQLVLLVGALGAVVVLLRFFRWHYLLTGSGCTPAFRTSYHVYAQGLFWGTVSPGRLGEFIKCYGLKQRYNYPYHASTLLVVIDRLYDLLLPILGAGIGYLHLLHVREIVYPALGLLAVVGIVVLKFFLDALVSPAARFLQRIKIIVNKDLLRAVLRRNFSAQGIVVVGLSTASYSILVTFAFFLGKYGYGMNMSGFDALFLVSVLILSCLLPVSILGLGTNEVILLAVAEAVLPDLFLPEKLIAFSLSFNLLNLISVLLLSGYVPFTGAVPKTKDIPSDETNDEAWIQG